MKNVIILHEYGSPQHFHGLTYLLREKGYKYSYYEVEFITQLKLAIRLLSFNYLYRGIRNLLFFLTFPFRRKTKVILSVAPYNKKLVWLRKLLKCHEAYYFTSYTTWDQSIYVHSYDNNPKIISEWHNFLLDDINHTFAVSNKTKVEMLKNGFAKENKISVVNHSYTTLISPEFDRKKGNVFISASQMAQHKGIEELLLYFAEHQDLRLILVGKGPLVPLVNTYTEKYSNIEYRGYISDQKKLFDVYQEANFFILNSHKTKTWEELFGMVLLEASACGVIPVATNHSGPCEIINDGVNGFICKEGEITKGIEKCVQMNDLEYKSFRDNAIKNGQQYYVKEISKKWIKILE